MKKEISDKAEPDNLNEKYSIARLRPGEIMIGETIFADTKGFFIAHPIRYIREFLEDYVFKMPL